MIVKYLANNFFDWLLFHAEVVHFAVRKNDAGKPRSLYFAGPST